MKKLVIFASGSGSNAENIIRYFQNGNTARVVAIFTNNPNAGVIERAGKYQIPVGIFGRQTFYETPNLDEELRNIQPDLIILAGFLWLFPARLVQQYPNKILNIHPALLPKFGGKGMYGDKVHRAVMAAGETEHGVTVHRVNEAYDEGDIVLQRSFPIAPNASIETVVEKIHDLEYTLFPEAIEKVLLEQIES
jgi:phosphoribosylglycinamide formyltransferase-1